MKQLFTWCHGPFKLEVSTPIKPNLENLTYNLKLYNTLNSQLKSVDSTELPQLNCLKECFSVLNSRDYKEHGCLVDSLIVRNQTNNNIIKSFRNSYRTIVSTDEERLGNYYIDIVRHDYNFKHSEFEREGTETSYSLVFGFPFPEYPSSCEKIEIGDLSREQISDFVESVSTFINN